MRFIADFHYSLTIIIGHAEGQGKVLNTQNENDKEYPRRWGSGELGGRGGEKEKTSKHLNNK